MKIPYEKCTGRQVWIVIARGAYSRSLEGELVQADPEHLVIKPSEAETFNRGTPPGNVIVSVADLVLFSEGSGT